MDASEYVHADRATNKCGYNCCRKALVHKEGEYSVATKSLSRKVDKLVLDYENNLQPPRNGLRQNYHGQWRVHLQDIQTIQKEKHDHIMQGYLAMERFRRQCSSGIPLHDVRGRINAGKLRIGRHLRDQYSSPTADVGVKCKIGTSRQTSSKRKTNTYCLLQGLTQSYYYPDASIKAEAMSLGGDSLDHQVLFNFVGEKKMWLWIPKGAHFDNQKEGNHFIFSAMMDLTKMEHFEDSKAMASYGPSSRDRNEAIKQLRAAQDRGSGSREILDKVRSSDEEA
ncbi:hypothetical protein G6011_01967 [Alternaria panax]|uniref:Uncharacterized protein n=1 Tax=Alternaria panax TaxID=48097 RepID=A0AAD4FI78_9PLEO|nr:hypothetical protein G6011_01967 [Alternaria panax]